MADFNDRYLEIRRERSWHPEIWMPNHDGILKNFIPLINDNSPCHDIQRLQLGFPKNATFRFNGYSGAVDKDRITHDIIQSAFGSGSRIRASNRSFQSANRIMSIDFFCIRHKQFIPKNQKAFKANNIQAVGTIVQKEHSQKNNKGKRCQSVIVEPEDDTSTEVSTKRRKTTSIRPLQKEECCQFGFTIFLCKDTNLWYLLRKTRYVFIVCVYKLHNSVLCPNKSNIY